MSNGRHSQTWLLAGKLLALVTVILFTGGRCICTNIPCHQRRKAQLPRLLIMQRVETPKN